MCLPRCCIATDTARTTENTASNSYSTLLLPVDSLQWEPVCLRSLPSYRSTRYNIYDIDPYFRFDFLVPFLLFVVYLKTICIIQTLKRQIIGLNELEGMGMGQSWPNFKELFGICQEEQRRTTKHVT
jgi:hypothetical protein